MVENPHTLSVSIAVESQAALVTFEGPLSFSLITYGSKHDSHFGSLCFYYFYIYEEHVWERDTLDGCVLWERRSPFFL